MAMELLAGFGRPAEAAARYHPQVALIDPSDTRNCLIWAVAGAIVVSIICPPNGLVHLAWAGGVFWYFIVAAWLRRRQKPGTLSWLPRRVTRPTALHPAFALLGMLGTLIFPFSMYLAPQAFANVAFSGVVRGDGLTMTDAFLHSWQRGVTLALLGFVVWLYAAIAWQRGYRTWSRWAGIVAYFALGLMCVIHAAPLGSIVGHEHFMIFESARANAVAMPIFGLVGALNILSSLFEAWRERSRITPAPSLQTG
jgi:hypothetical protein